jgi:hypothetical protein
MKPDERRLPYGAGFLIALAASMALYLLGYGAYLVFVRLV